MIRSRFVFLSGVLCAAVVSVAASAGFASIVAPPLIEVLQVSPLPSVLFLGLAFLAVAASAGVVIALGLVERRASAAISRALGLDFPPPQTGTPELTSTV